MGAGGLPASQKLRMELKKGCVSLDYTILSTLVDVWNFSQ